MFELRAVEFLPQANRRLRASRLAGGPFMFLPIFGCFVQLHVRIMVRAAFSIIAESGDPGAATPGIKDPIS